MLQSKAVLDTAPNLTALICKCIRRRNLKLGTQLHSQLIKTALNLNTFLSNRLIDLFSKCDSIDSAQKVFDDLPVKNNYSWNTILCAYCKMGLFHEARKLLDTMPEPNLVSYNTIISSLAQHGFYDEAMKVFKSVEMEIFRDGLWIDEFTVVSLVNACALSGGLKLLSQVHGMAIVNGLILNLIVCNAFIDAYGKCSKAEVSCKIFSQMEERDVVSWTSLVVAYAQACKMVDAYRVFNQMPQRNVFSWTALITGFAKIGQANQALNLFSEMLKNDVVPSTFTYVIVLGACADLALIERGKQVHGLILRKHRVCHLHNTYVLNALVDMYCKCGDMKTAMALFKRFNGNDLVTWNSVIIGFAQNGQADLSLSLFEEMIKRNIKPNSVSFLGVLSSCSHTGRLYEGLQLLDRMEKDFNVIPQLDHYAILIDLLGRKNQLAEALKLIQNANFSHHVGMWGALLSACRIHENTELAQRAAEVLFELEPENAARYVMLSNIYTAAGLPNDACRVRRLMDEQGLRKETAYSWIEVRNARHEFVSKDKLHSQNLEIRDLLHKLVDHMKDIGHVPLVELFSHEDDGWT
ncbi:hypothetical protein M9H77_12690 [Catharanthus roseus]|uniref:Uncharacterized protein n=1 Tax=Catharanthus roseus TaxID=4058 RepID=A0ACC0BIA6_CATRO|nr:hypothetical protein M9H77_12690 [Catharanthus roseus]